MRYSGANHRADLGLRRNEEVRVHVPLSTKPQKSHRAAASDVTTIAKQRGHDHSAGGTDDDAVGHHAGCSSRSVFTVFIPGLGEPRRSRSPAEVGGGDVDGGAGFADAARARTCDPPAR
jgi:hypothetical protein